MNINSIEDLVIEHIKTAVHNKYADSIVQLSGDCSVFLKKLEGEVFYNNIDVSFYVANSSAHKIFKVKSKFRFAGTGYKTNLLTISPVSSEPPTIVYADFSFSNDTDELLELINNTQTIAAYVVLPSNIEVNLNEPSLASALKLAGAKLINIGQYDIKSAYLIIKETVVTEDSEPLGTNYLSERYSQSINNTWGYSNTKSFINSLSIASKMDGVKWADGKLPPNHTPKEILEKTKNLDEMQALYDDDREKINSLFKELADLNPLLLSMLDLKDYSIEDFYSKSIHELDKTYWGAIQLLVEPNFKKGVSGRYGPVGNAKELFQSSIHPICSGNSKYGTFSSDTVRALVDRIVIFINGSISNAINHFYQCCVESGDFALYKTTDPAKHLLPNKIRTSVFLDFDTRSWNERKLPPAIYELDDITAPLQTICNLAGVKNITLNAGDQPYYKSGGKIEFTGSIMDEDPEVLLTLRLYKNGIQLMVFNDRLIRNINILMCKNNQWAKDAKDAFEEMKMTEGFEDFEKAYNQISVNECAVEDTLLGDYI